MSDDLRITLEDAVLAALARGAESVSELANALNVDEDDVARVVERLKAEGLVREEVTGWWVFRRRVLRLTEEGFNRASKALERLERIAEEVRRRLSSGEGVEGLEEVLALTYVIPLLGWLNLIDLALINSMLMGAWVQDLSGSN